jgi:hypothetical protein
MLYSEVNACSKTAARIQNMSNNGKNCRTRLPRKARGPQNMAICASNAKALENWFAPTISIGDVTQDVSLRIHWIFVLK